MRTPAIAYDDDLIAEIDKEMGWIEKNGSSPSKTARDLGVHCKFLDGSFSSATAWYGTSKVWSVCVLGGVIETTLLARSFPALKKLFRKLWGRQSEPERWKPYYQSMWMRRYFKWICKKDDSCVCQICRIKRSHKDDSCVCQICRA